MANQKVSARVTLASGSVSPATDILPIVDVSAGAFGSKKITINDLFTGWGFTSAGATVAKGTLAQQKTHLGIGRIEYNPDIAYLDIEIAESLDSVTTTDKTAGFIQQVVIANVLYTYRLTNGSTPEDPPHFIVPNDFAPGTNEKYWGLIGAYLGSELFAGYAIFGGLMVGVNFKGSFDSGVLTENRSYLLPNVDGTFAIERRSMVVTVAASGDTIDIPAFQDVFINIASISSPITSVAIQFPASLQTRDGQMVMLYSEKAITAFTCSATMSDNTPSTKAAFKTLTFIFQSETGVWIFVEQ